MKRVLVSTMAMLFLLMAGTAGAMGQRGRVSVTIMPPVLPAIVVLEDEPYYAQGGFYYHYTDDRWLYAQSKSGPWADLPRDHYPKEVRHRGRDQQHDHRRDNDDRNRDKRDDDRGRDNRR
ncbi:MAG: hypothetical protein HGA96_00005 [Desulfobulbaceae bacterium]|nr:hypothetical protein [Desulfobulbaceae bacterium]